MYLLFAQVHFGDIQNEGSLYMFVCLFVCLLACLLICFLVCLFICLFVFVCTSYISWKSNSGKVSPNFKLQHGHGGNLPIELLFLVGSTWNVVACICDL